MHALRRPLLVLVGLLALAWLAAAGLVLFRAPEGAQRRGEVFAWQGAHTEPPHEFPYEPPHEPPHDAAREVSEVTRGPLDRAAGTFTLALRFAVNEPGALATVGLAVTHRTPWSLADDEAWERVAVATIADEDGWCVATVPPTTVPATALAYVIQVTRTDGQPGGGHARTLPTAPTLLGRLHDELARSPLFRWLPHVR